VIPLRYRVFLWAGLLLAVSWISVALLDVRGGDIVAVGYLLGSLYAHATLAASWAALGPGRLRWRLPASLAWIFLLGGALAINIGSNGDGEAVIVIGLSFLAQWIILQAPLWGLKAGLQAQLSYVGDAPSAVDDRPWQFGIRQLLIVTTIVGVVFGVGRVAIGTLLARFSTLGDGEPIIFLFLACSAIVFSLPLLVAALLERWTLLGVALALAMISVGTLCEAPLLQTIRNNTPPFRPNLWDLVAVNGFTSLLILLVAGTVRFNGYSLTRRTGERPA
jgi:hypothetical protein